MCICSLSHGKMKSQQDLAHESYLRIIGVVSEGWIGH